MKKLTIFYSPKYHEKVTHLDQEGKKEYFLDTVIKPLWVYKCTKEIIAFFFKEPDIKLTEEDLLKVHSREYLDSLKQGFPSELSMSSGLRWVPELYEASISSVSGYYSSALQSIKDGVSGTLSTNFHHAKQNHGSGFCVLNGVAITAKKLISEKIAAKILILDCDYHYGDGNTEIFENNKQVQIFDIYGGLHSTASETLNASNVRAYQVNSAEEYFSKLGELAELLDNFKPEIVLYDAGMDVWTGSRIGKISGMNEENIRRRETFIFTACKERNIPVAFMIGGGYVKYKNDSGELLSVNEVEENKRKLAKIHKITLEEGYKAT
jgi:acetoin utilization deacetylase AcuC-like enzyme